MYIPNLHDNKIKGLGSQMKKNEAVKSLTEMKQSKHCFVYLSPQQLSLPRTETCFLGKGVAYFLLGADDWLNVNQTPPTPANHQGMPGNQITSANVFKTL